MKYIIDIPDFDKYNMPSPTKGRVVAIPIIIGDKTFNILTEMAFIGPYTEPDLNIAKDNPVHLCDSCKRVDSIKPCPIKKNDILCGEDGEGGKGICCCKAYMPETTARKVVEDEVWEFAGRLYYSEEYGGMNNKEFRSAFYGESAESVALNMSYQEAKARYEAWEKQKDDAVKQKVITLADEIGIHKLYAIVRDIRGE